MSVVQYKKYFWLVDTIRSAGKITKEQIDRKWSSSRYNDSHETSIPDTSFYRVRRDIEELFDIEILCDRADAHKMTRTQYIKERVGREEPEMSNGECAMQYFTNSIDDNSIIFLDEPENSLSAEWQVKLADFSDGASWISLSTHNSDTLAIPVGSTQCAHL